MKISSFESKLNRVPIVPQEESMAVFDQAQTLIIACYGMLSRGREKNKLKNFQNLSVIYLFCRQ